ncbi:FAD:protein FMN transferase [endosymbiont 'TC1' of Trimyema compressum]|uniref:FAD:protein FMN transferase n=1 Tax=endosymbiont 'TC1' of Trimyema compressum TaxID=243899 RepID=UPI0013922985|nr:FAD:protein FMN transferase [endosymbiont 'TC1' of Trimyema compressum]
MTTNKKRSNKKTVLTIGLFLLIAVIAVLFVFTTNRTSQSQKLEETQILMDTPVTLTLYGANEKTLRTDKNEAFALFSKIDKLSNRYDIIEGNIGYINSESGKTITIDPLLAEQLETAIAYSQKTDNQFNIGLGKLIELWKKKEIENTLPTEDEISLSLKNTDSSEILLADNRLSIPEGMVLDLGAVSKGYAIEKTWQLLNAKQHLTGAIINGGGNVKVLGTPPGKDSYRIGVQDPREPDQLIGTTTLTHEDTISTSGDYQRYYTINGIKCPHIFSSRTGFPAKENVAVTVITQNGMLADILSTTLYLLPYKEGLAFLENLLFKVEALWISKDLKITKTTGFPFALEDEKGHYIYETP